MLRGQQLKVKLFEVNMIAQLYDRFPSLSFSRCVLFESKLNMMINNVFNRIVESL